MSGHEVIYSADYWSPAHITYSNNFNHQSENIDISDTDKITKKILYLGKPEFIVGGPPCQDFSSAGKGIEGGRAELTVSFSRIIADTGTDYFIMENVPQARKSKSYAAAKEIFYNKGYGLSEIVVDASYYGVPQRRKRLFLIGSLNHEDKEFEDFYKYQSPLPTTVRDYLPDIGIEYYYRHPRSYARRAIFSIDEPSPTIRGISRDRPSSYKIHEGDKSADIDIRALTQAERSLIQTFPSDYNWHGNKSEIDQLIGNAVPPILVHNLISYLNYKIFNAEEPKSFYKYLLEKDDMEKYEKYILSIRRNSSICKKYLKDPSDSVVDEMDTITKHAVVNLSEFLKGSR